jgi:AcrR family transcriptional regulator
VTSERLAGNERREAILEASLALFAQHGLHGVTTRRIAQAAGISEALLYRYFRGKEELFEELQRSCVPATTRVAERLVKLEASTSTLVLAMYFMVDQIVRTGPGRERQLSVKRMMLGSLKDDGAFARGFLKQNLLPYLPKLTDCLQAAARAGDLVDRPKNLRARVLFAHHLAVAVAQMRLPRPPVLDYEADEESLLEEIVRFVLRGLGLKAEAIDRHLNPKALALLVQGVGGDR